MISSAIFIAAVALQNKFPLSTKFSKNAGSMLKTYAHDLSTSGRYMAGFVAKSFGGCCGSTKLTGASWWPSGNSVCPQKIVSVSTEFSHNRSALVLDSSKGVCCYHSSSQSSIPGFSKLRPADQIWLGKPFHPAAKHILPIMKKYIHKKCVNLVECNISRKNRITQGVRPRNCCAIAMWSSPKKLGEPWYIWTG